MLGRRGGGGHRRARSDDGARARELPGRIGDLLEEIRGSARIDLQARRATAAGHVRPLIACTAWVAIDDVRVSMPLAALKCRRAFQKAAFKPYHA